MASKSSLRWKKAIKRTSREVIIANSFRQAASDDKKHPPSEKKKAEEWENDRLSEGQGCDVPRLIGDSRLCIVCGRPAEQHKQYTAVEGTQAEEAKNLRIEQTNSNLRSIRESRMGESEKPQLLRIGLGTNPRKRSGPEDGGYRVIFAGNFFKDTSSSNRWAKFGDVSVPVSYLSPYLLACTCPARKSPYPEVTVQLTLDGGRTFLTAPHPWTYTRYRNRKSRVRASDPVVAVWGSGKYSLNSPIHHHRRFNIEKNSDAKEMQKDSNGEEEEQETPFFVNFPTDTREIRDMVVGEKEIAMLSWDGRVVIDERKLSTSGKLTGNTHMLGLGYDGVEERALTSEEDNEKDGKTLHENLGMHYSAKGAMRPDDHRFSPIEKIAFGVISAKSSWFFCAPSAKHDYIAALAGAGVIRGKKKRMSSKRRQKGSAETQKDAHLQKRVKLVELNKFARSALKVIRWRKIEQIACGARHFAFVSGVTDGHVLYTFGNNEHGQLGSGDRIFRPNPYAVESFLKPSRRKKGPPRRAHMANMVACGPDYTIAVVTNVLKGRTSVYSWGSVNQPPASYHHIEATARQGKPHPVAYLRLENGNQRRISTSLDALVPIQILRFCRTTDIGTSQGPIDAGIVLHPWLPASLKQSNKAQFIGQRAVSLPFSVMPLHLQCLVEDRFDAWLRHTEQVKGNQWSSLQRNGRYGINADWLQRGSKTQLTKDLFVSFNTRHMAVEHYSNILRQCIDSLDQTISHKLAFSDDIRSLHGAQKRQHTHFDSSDKLLDNVRDMLEDATREQGKLRGRVKTLEISAQKIHLGISFLSSHRDRVNKLLRSKSSRVSPDEKNGESRHVTINLEEPKANPLQMENKVNQVPRFSLVVNGRSIAASDARRSIEDKSIGLNRKRRDNFEHPKENANGNIFSAFDRSGEKPVSFNFFLQNFVVSFHLNSFILLPSVTMSSSLCMALIPDSSSNIFSENRSRRRLPQSRFFK